jgi:hypothetical protein
LVDLAVERAVPVRVVLVDDFGPAAEGFFFGVPFPGRLLLSIIQYFMQRYELSCYALGYWLVVIVISYLLSVIDLI